MQVVPWNFRGGSPHLILAEFRGTTILHLFWNLGSKFWGAGVRRPRKTRSSAPECLQSKQGKWLRPSFSALFHLGRKQIIPTINFVRECDDFECLDAHICIVATKQPIAMSNGRDGRLGSPFVELRIQTSVVKFGVLHVGLHCSGKAILQSLIRCLW